MRGGWETLLDADWDRLYWLKYNVERVLGGSGPEQKALGASEVRVTLEQVRLMAEDRDKLPAMLKCSI